MLGLCLIFPFVSGSRWKNDMNSGWVAQLVEQKFLGLLVAGSNPVPLRNVNRRV